MNSLYILKWAYDMTWEIPIKWGGVRASAGFVPLRSSVYTFPLRTLKLQCFLLKYIIQTYGSGGETETS